MVCRGHWRQRAGRVGVDRGTMIPECVAVGCWLRQIAAGACGGPGKTPSRNKATGGGGGGSYERPIAAAALPALKARRARHPVCDVCCVCVSLTLPRLSFICPDRHLVFRKGARRRLSEGGALPPPPPSPSSSPPTSHPPPPTTHTTHNNTINTTHNTNLQLN